MRVTFKTSIFCLFLLIAIAVPRIASLEQQESYVFPLMTPRFTSGFGVRNHPIHKRRSHHRGIDLAAPLNAPVRVIRDGSVVFADTYAGYGKLVTVKHDDGMTTLYGHLVDILVNPGDKVKAGSVIGRVGSTGQSTGPHLHFEIRKFGKAVDPKTVFPKFFSEAEG